MEQVSNTDLFSYDHHIRVDVFLPRLAAPDETVVGVGGLPGV